MVDAPISQNGHAKHAPETVADDVYSAYLKAKEVLTCRMIAEPYNMLYIFDQLNAEMFTQDDRYALSAIELYRERKMYSAFTLAEKAGEPGRGEHAQRLSQMHSDTTLPEAFEYFRIVYGQYVESFISSCTASLIRQGHTSEEIKIKQDELRRKKGLNVSKQGSDGKKEFSDALESALIGKHIDYPIKPALASIREKIEYLEPGEYVVVAGRTGMGKSYYALNEVYENAKRGIPVSYINLENTPKSVMARLWQMHTGIKWQNDYSKEWYSVKNGLWLKHYGLTPEDVTKMRTGWDEVQKLPIKVFNTGRKLQNIVGTVQQDYYERGTQAFFFDYLQLIRDSPTRQKVDDLAEISATLRLLCLDLNVVNYAMAQISREGEKRASDHRPTIADIRSCGDIEQDASTILLLYRPSEYGIENDAEGNEYGHEYADGTIGKGRNSGKGFCKFRFNWVEGFYDAPKDQPFYQSENAEPIDYTIPISARPKNEADIPF